MLPVAIALLVAAMVAPSTETLGDESPTADALRGNTGVGVCRDPGGGVTVNAGTGPDVFVGVVLRVPPPGAYGAAVLTFSRAEYEAACP